MSETDNMTMVFFTAAILIIGGLVGYGIAGGFSKEPVQPQAFQGIVFDNNYSWNLENPAIETTGVNLNYILNGKPYWIDGILCWDAKIGSSAYSYNALILQCDYNVSKKPIKKQEPVLESSDIVLTDFEIKKNVSVDKNYFVREGTVKVDCFKDYSAYPIERIYTINESFVLSKESDGCAFVEFGRKQESVIIEIKPIVESKPDENFRWCAYGSDYSKPPHAFTDDDLVIWNCTKLIRESKYSKSTKCVQTSEKCSLPVVESKPDMNYLVGYPRYHCEGSYESMTCVPIADIK